MHKVRNKDNRVGLSIHEEPRSMDRGRAVRFMVCASILSVCMMLCGCTRREQLVLATDTSGIEQGGQYTAQSVEGQDTPGAVEGQQDASGQTAPEERSMQESGGGEQPLSDSTEAAQADEPQVICVHVCGAVKRPDVYELPAGSRVYEAVRKAGGFTECADENYVNQAQTLSDGVKLVIPTTEQTNHMSSEGGSAAEVGIVGEQPAAAEHSFGVQVQGESTGDGQEASDDKININTASEAELCDIPGIGASRAAAIVAYRQERGGFTSVEDIMNVSGIKEGTYAKIKDRIKVN